MAEKTIGSLRAPSVSERANQVIKERGKYRFLQQRNSGSELRKAYLVVLRTGYERQGVRKTNATEILGVIVKYEDSIRWRAWAIAEYPNLEKTPLPTKFKSRNEAAQALEAYRRF